MDNCEREAALVSLENAIRRVLRCGITRDVLEAEIAAMLTFCQRRQNVAKTREKAKA